MGTTAIKISKRIISMIKVIVWKILYLNKIKFGRKNVFYPGNHITIEKKGRLELGGNCFFNHGCSINVLEYIKIGDDCIFGENVKIYDHNHEYRGNELIRRQGFRTKSVIIGNNCWVGSNVIILPGVTIGNNVVIGAGAIITKNVQDNEVIINKLEQRILRR